MKWSKIIFINSLKDLIEDGDQVSFLGSHFDRKRWIMSTDIFISYINNNNADNDLAKCSVFEGVTLRWKISWVKQRPSWVKAGRNLQSQNVYLVSILTRIQKQFKVWEQGYSWGKYKNAWGIGCYVYRAQTRKIQPSHRGQTHSRKNKLTMAVAQCRKGLSSSSLPCWGKAPESKCRGERAEILKLDTTSFIYLDNLV